MLGADPLVTEVVAELSSGDAYADPLLIEGIAEHLVSGGGSLGSIAELAGVTVVECSLGMHGFHTEGIVLIRAKLSERLKRVAWVHECCHPVATKAGFGHCHADVWRLTLATLMSRAILREQPTWRAGDLAARCVVPWWVAWARLDMMRVTPVA